MRNHVSDNHVSDVNHGNRVSRHTYRATRAAIFCLSVAVSLVVALSFWTVARADPEVIYISPNNDGVQDFLEVPLKIREKRYVNEWSFTILNESGDVVRTIGNKIAFPTKFTFKSFSKALLSAKKGVDIPQTITWNGFLDDGSVAPDGVYYYQFTASDDNGNAATTVKRKVIVDNTPPTVELANLEGDDKIFGEGSKTTLKIAQTGSSEKLWTARITNARGDVVRSFKWQDGPPKDVVWNGLNGRKSIVPDGVYNYEITSTDLAGNVSEKAVITNIIFSAEKPEIAVAISGSRYFAPAPKGDVARPKKTMDFALAIPSPSASVNSLTNWEVSIVGKDNNTVYYKKSGKSNPPSLFAFDGKGTSGEGLADGEYRARVTAKYLNGYEPSPVYSPVFVLDNEAPNATVTLPGNTVFNGQNDFEVQLKETPEPAYTGEKAWLVKVVSSTGEAVTTWDCGSSLPDSVAWDGLDDAGKFAADGSYRFALEVSELSGNSRTILSKPFTLDTSKTELALSVSPTAFSPNADGLQDVATITPLVRALSGIESYEVRVFSGSGTVRVFSGSGSVPSSFSWDGKDEAGSPCSDGTYFATIKTLANSGAQADAQSSTFTLDTTPPAVSVKPEYTLFSPDGVSSRQVVPFKFTGCTTESKWTAEIRAANDQVVKTYTWSLGTPEDFAWDGTDDSGNKVSDGSYYLEVYSRDAAGNLGQAQTAAITLDSRAVGALITAEHRGVSPNGDGVLDAQQIDVKLTLPEGISSWKLDIVDELTGKSVKTYSSADAGSVPPASFEWAGDTTGGQVAEGTFRAVFSAEWEKGNKVSAASSSFVCTARPPALTASTAPTYFSPDNDGNDDDLFIELKCDTIANLKDWSFTIKDRNDQPFWKTSGKSSITERIVWDGRGNNGELVQSAEDYAYEFEASDDLGMSSKIAGTISVDVLIIMDGSKLKMQIPSIIFRGDEADFGIRVVDSKGKVVKSGITQAQADNNIRVLKRVAEILKKFKDYKVTIVGHANRMSDNEKEETQAGTWGKALIPLSEQRAEYVKGQLVKLGISSSRLSVEGKGGTEPIADRKDKSVNWKNRRVEFILEK